MILLSKRSSISRVSWLTRRAPTSSTSCQVGSRPVVSRSTMTRDLSLKYMSIPLLGAGQHAVVWSVLLVVLHKLIQLIGLRGKPGNLDHSGFLVYEHLDAVGLDVHGLIARRQEMNFLIARSAKRLISACLLLVR